MSLLRLCFTSLLLLLSHFLPLSHSLNDQGLALLSFKQSLQQNSGEAHLPSWNSSDANPCSWDGIGCNELARVVSLTLPYKQLTGSFHLDSTNLTDLRHVNLRNNNLFGTIPPELFLATGLKTLVLSGNSIAGPIPSQIGNLDHLQTLDLSHNSINGSFPLSLLNCKRLKQLVVSSNFFSGSLPDGIGANLVTLETLNLSFNAFSGPIPGDIGNLTNLQGALDLSHNLFTGAIPSSLGTLPETLYIDLSYNNLAGPIPRTRTLLDAGPTAFVGNPLLCGLPTKASCLSMPEKPKPAADDPSTSTEPGVGRDRPASPYLVLIATVSGTVLVIGVMALSFAYWYRRDHEPGERGKRNADVATTERSGKEMMCFRRDDVESLASENVEQYVFLKLEAELGFDLEQLLKASAFLLGTSGVGIMYKVVTENGTSLAVRRLEDGGGQRFREFQGEVEAIGKIRHPNVVKLLACCWCVSEKLLIYEYVPNGNLATAIHGRNGVTNLKPMSWSVRLQILRGVAKGLAFIHECSPKRYVHGHLKPTSILLAHNMEPRIANFGLNRLAFNPVVEESSEPLALLDSRTPSQCSPYALTPINSKTSNVWLYYEAPEVVSRPGSSKPSQKWDVYSYGMILLETVTGKSPTIMSASEMDLARWVQLSLDVEKPVADIVDPFLAHDSGKESQMVDVIKIGLACVGANPDKRPSMRNVSIALEKLGGGE